MTWYPVPYVPWYDSAVGGYAGSEAVASGAGSSVVWGYGIEGVYVMA